MSITRTFSLVLLSLLLIEKANGFLLLLEMENDPAWKLIRTPHGYRPSKCVHQTKEREAILTEFDSHTAVFYPKSKSTDTFIRDEDCVRQSLSLLSRTRNNVGAHDEEALATHQQAVAVKQWIDYAHYSTPSTMGNFTSVYKLPSADPVRNEGQLLYFFIGFENMDSGGVSIVQPVVNYCGNSTEDYCGEAYGQGWAAEPWNCCPNGQSWFGPTIPLSNSDSVDAWVFADASSTEIGVSLKDGTPTTLTVTTNRRAWNWACATLEQYGVTSCQEYNQLPFSCTDMKLVTLSGQTVHPKWELIGNTQCKGGVVVNDDYNVDIYGTAKP